MSDKVRRRIWPWIGLLLLTTGVVEVLVLMFKTPADNDKQALVGTLVQAVAAVVALAVPAAVWLWRKRTTSPPVVNVDAVANALAVALRGQWESAAVERRLRHPVPVPIRWAWSDRPVAGPKSEATGGRNAGRRLRPLPGFEQVKATDLSEGGQAKLLKIYGGLDSGRIALLGGPGAGKTSAAIVLLLDALAHRAGVTDTVVRATVPVPVLLTIAGWDPVNVPLADWVGSRLDFDHGTRSFGGGAAKQLLSAGRIALILDGLDDLPKQLRPIALRALDLQMSGRLVLLTRSQELVDAVTGGHLSGAAPLELRAINAAQAADYLVRCRVDPAPPDWQKLTHEVRTNKDGGLALALSTPLMLSLVRDTYPPGEPLDALFAAADARTTVEDHLLDRVLIAAYKARPGQRKPRYTLEQARTWLGYIAAQMAKHATRDLKWWQIHRWQPRRHRAIATALALGPSAGLTFALMFAFLFQLVFGVFGLRSGVVFGLVLGLVVGLVVGLKMSDQPRQLSSIRWSGFRSKQNTVVGLVVALVVGLALPLGVGIVAGSGLGPVTESVTYLVTGLIFGLAIWFLGGLINGLLRPSTGALSPTSPTVCWHRDRTSGLVAGFVAGLVAGLGVALVVGLVVPLMAGVGNELMIGLVVGLVAGLVVGLVAGLVVGLRSATGQARLAFAQIRLSGNGPLRMMRFLEDARERQVLRTGGPVYQFRHARLQDRLADAYEQRSQPAPRCSSNDPRTTRRRLLAPKAAASHTPTHAEHLGPGIAPPETPQPGAPASGRSTDGC